MQYPMPAHVAACPACRPRWVAWREADFDPARPVVEAGWLARALLAEETEMVDEQ